MNTLYSPCIDDAIAPSLLEKTKTKKKYKISSTISTSCSTSTECQSSTTEDWKRAVTREHSQLLSKSDKFLLENARISAMYTTITHYNTAILLDRTNIGKSKIDLPDHECRRDAAGMKTSSLSRMIALRTLSCSTQVETPCRLSGGDQANSYLSIRQVRETMVIYT
jgi:hypothetical protein